MSEGGIKIISENRKAYHNYFIEDRYEAGMILKGTEVKSLREGTASLQDAYAIFKSGGLYLLNAHIPPYKQGNRENHEPLRTRKLLLNKSEINKILVRVEQQGYSLIPIKMYFKKGICKIEIALAKGKKSHDKRESTKEREIKRSMAKMMKR